MKTWKDRFECYLKDDAVADRMLRRLVRKGFPLDQVLTVLEGYTNPGAGRKLREVFEKFAPLRERTGRLAKQCAKLSWELKIVYGGPFGIVWPEADEMLALADAMIKGAASLVRADHSKAYSPFTERKMWKHFPLALLYAELKIPESLSWVNWQPLYRLACEAHGVHGEIAPKSLATNHRRFVKRFPRASSMIPRLAQLLAKIRQ